MFKIRAKNYAEVLGVVISIYDTDKIDEFMSCNVYSSRSLTISQRTCHRGLLFMYKEGLVSLKRIIRPKLGSQTIVTIKNIDKIRERFDEIKNIKCVTNVSPIQDGVEQVQ